MLLLVHVPMGGIVFIPHETDCSATCTYNGILTSLFMHYVTGYVAIMFLKASSQRRYCVLPTMHCFLWDILYRWSCGIFCTGGHV